MTNPDGSEGSLTDLFKDTHQQPKGDLSADLPTFPQWVFHFIPIYYPLPANVSAHKGLILSLENKNIY